MYPIFHYFISPTHKEDIILSRDDIPNIAYSRRECRQLR